MDNTAAISMATANGPTTRSKHIDSKAHFLREQLKKGTIRTIYVQSNQQIADLFTKPLPSSKIPHLTDLVRDYHNYTAAGR